MHWRSHHRGQPPWTRLRRLQVRNIRHKRLQGVNVRLRPSHPHDPQLAHVRAAHRRCWNCSQSDVLSAHGQGKEDRRRLQQLHDSDHDLQHGACVHGPKQSDLPHHPRPHRLIDCVHRHPPPLSRRHVRYNADRRTRHGRSRQRRGFGGRNHRSGAPAAIGPFSVSSVDQESVAGRMAEGRRHGRVRDRGGPLHLRRPGCGLLLLAGQRSGFPGFPRDLLDG
mmetsp:Transcript_4160/g.9914  ORF Transcript_4160/g.9914 Transcript_4160/m.9914 type:complete len:222 (-) Transcript_4160:5555-6220(-)